LPAYPPAWAQPHFRIFPGRISLHFSTGYPGFFVKPLRRGRGVQNLPPPQGGGGVPLHPEENGRGVAGLPPRRIPGQASYPAAGPEVILPGFFDGTWVFALVSIPEAQGKSGH